MLNCEGFVDTNEVGVVVPFSDPYRMRLINDLNNENEIDSFSSSSL